jgi:hypothetical protein
MTIENPDFVRGKKLRKIALTCRLIRFRTTARLLTFRLIEMPIRVGCSGRFRTRSVKQRDPRRNPR